MLKLIVCIKQVPMVSELPWDPKTKTLMRNLAEGMINPACAHALEAALQLKEIHGAQITAITMGPPMAREVLHEAIAMGADEGILLTDPMMAGADTWVTSNILGAAITKMLPDADLILCGSQTSDSETAQVGPQLAEVLDLPGAAYVEHLEIKERLLRVERECDHFHEILEMDLPAVVTIGTDHYAPRYTALAGLEEAFVAPRIATLGADDLGLDPKAIGVTGSPTQIINVFSPTAEKKNIVLRGSAKQSVDTLLDKFGDLISAAIGKDLISHDHQDRE